MKNKSVAALLMTLCLLTGCSNNATSENAYTTDNTTSAAVETTQLTTAGTSQGRSDDSEYTNVSKNEKEMIFYRDNMKIFGKLYLPEGEGPFPAVIFSGGMRESYTDLETFASLCAQNGIAGVVFDFIGTGGQSQSEGSPLDMSPLTEAADLNAVFDKIASEPEIDSKNIFLWGHSLGGLVSTYVAEQRHDDIKALILVEPSYQMRDQVRERYPEGSEIPDVVDASQSLGKAFAEDILSFDIYDKMPDFDSDVLLFEGTTSESIGGAFPEYLERAAQTFRSVHVEAVEGANHFFSGDAGVQMREKTIDFIKENIG
ncbi:MAG: alpha/beta fold hydrolase [Oscillospiraceae bacterium]|nr:alpha/beta fold hydrolase [Oscillospiraceae bacterium]